MLWIVLVGIHMNSNPRFPDYAAGAFRKPLNIGISDNTHRGDVVLCFRIRSDFLARGGVPSFLGIYTNRKNEKMYLYLYLCTNSILMYFLNRLMISLQSDLIFMTITQGIKVITTKPETERYSLIKQFEQLGQ